jgi:hypothetical protein
MKNLICLFTIIALTACANNIGSAPTESYSGFDDAKIITLPKHGNACGGWVCTGLGGQWNEAHPQEVLLFVTVFNDITGITGALLNIDGQKIRLKAQQATTSFDQQAMKISSKTFLVELDLIQRIVGAKKVWLRVETPDGSLEDAIIDGETDSKAFYALKRFLSKIEAVG